MADPVAEQAPTEKPSSGAQGTRPVFFLATPLHDGRVHHAYLTGALQMAAAAPGQLMVSTFEGSFLAVNRDMLTARFLRSKATHMLCVDSDIGWGPGDVEKLLQANQDFMSGMYARKQAEGRLASSLMKVREGELVECLHAAAGFLLLTRSCVERLVAAHPELEYQTPQGPAWALWSPIFSGAPYGEDTSFCARWRALGGRIWAHSQVVLKHYGDAAYLPRGYEPAKPQSE